MRKLTTPLFIKHIRNLGNNPRRYSDSDIELYCKMYQLGFCELLKVSYNIIADSENPIEKMHQVIKTVRERKAKVKTK